MSTTTVASSVTPTIRITTFEPTITDYYGDCVVSGYQIAISTLCTPRLCRDTLSTSVVTTATIMTASSFMTAIINNNDYSITTTTTMTVITIITTHVMTHGLYIYICECICMHML